MRYVSRILAVAPLVLMGCPRSRPVVVIPPVRDAGVETPVPEVQLQETRLRPRALVGNGEDCTVYCSTRFGPGIGVTCQAWLDTGGRCHPYCYYENGWWFDMSTGSAIRRPDGTTNDQRPDLGQVPPFGYCSENGCTQDVPLQCPWKGRGRTPPDVQEFCSTMARSEYHEGYAFCGQGQ